MEKKYTDADVKAMVDEAIENYKKEQNIEELKADLEAQMTAINETKTELETKEAELTTAKEEFEASLESYISKEDHEAALEAAVSEAIASLEKFNDRVAKLAEAGIELDENGIERVKKADDETFEWLLDSINQSKDKVAEAGDPEDEEPTDEPVEETVEEVVDEETEEPADEPTDEVVAEKLTASQDLNETPPTGIDTNADGGSALNTISTVLGKTLHHIK